MNKPWFSWTDKHSIGPAKDRTFTCWKWSWIFLVILFLCFCFTPEVSISHNVMENIRQSIGFVIGIIFGILGVIKYVKNSHEIDLFMILCVILSFGVSILWITWN